MSGTTIDQSTTLTGVFISSTTVVQQDAGTPPGDPVVVVFDPSVALLSTFTVQDEATLNIGSGLSVGAGDHFIIGANGTLEVGSSVNVSVLNDISFASGMTGGVLLVDAGVNVALLSNISGFAAGDSLDFAAAGTPVSANGFTDSYVNGATNFTVALQGGGTEDFSLAGNYVGDNFSLGSDGHGGFVFSDTTCFAPGTRILTERGEVAVEALAIGDIAVLADGTTQPIVFIGHRFFNLARHPRPAAVRPVRMAAGALADGVPGRELVVSPDHAFLLGGVLVQAKDLMDGAMITQDFRIRSIRYYHVELQDHGILLAEGAAAESYLDTGHRGMFENASEPVILAPDLMQMRREAESVAPLCMDGEKLRHIRAALHARKVALGFVVHQRTDVRMRAGGKSLAPESVLEGVFSFSIPDGVVDVMLTSPTFVPAEIDPGSNDRRRLGLAMTGIFVDDRGVALDSVVTRGLHARAAGDPHAWTDGAAHLALPPGTTRLAICVAGLPQGWERKAA